MKVVLAGAYGNLGADVFRELVKNGHEVIALDIVQRDIGIDSGFKFIRIDVTDPKTLEGVCDGADAVITTVGLTKGSATVSNYDIDYQGNLNLLNEAKKAGIKNFVYISVVKADTAPDVPMVNSKYLFEQELKKSGITYVIHRPTGYFYDIIKVFKPMIEKGKVTLLGKEPVYANIVSTEDFARFIVEHMNDENVTYSVGGKETVIKRASPAIFDILAWVNKCKKNGKDAIIKFSKWTLTHDMVGDTVAGDMSFAEYIKKSFEK